MKKITMFILVITLFLSCTNQKAEQNLITRQLESKLAMEEKVNRIATQLRADCDSNLMQMAKAKVDSIILKKGKKSK